MPHCSLLKCVNGRGKSGEASQLNKLDMYRASLASQLTSRPVATVSDSFTGMILPQSEVGMWVAEPYGGVTSRKLPLKQ